MLPSPPQANAGCSPVIMRMSRSKDSKHLILDGGDIDRPVYAQKVMVVCFVLHLIPI